MGIFDSKVNLFTRYQVTLRFRDKLMGGVPRDPKVIEGWLRKKAGLENGEEVRQVMLRTLLELGADVTPEMSYDQLRAASEKVAGTTETTGFKRNEAGLYVEGRQVKAMIKESVNILFAGEKWGSSTRANAIGEEITAYAGKGPRSFVAERVFVNTDEISLGVTEPADIQMVIGHVIGPKGPRSTLGYHEFTTRSAITFEVKSTNDLKSGKDSVKPEKWEQLWVHAQDNGLGALRSQGYGKFDLEAFDKL